MADLRERKTKDREFDIIVFGATSFAGALVAEYLIRNYKQSTVRWTIAGRSLQRLEDVKKNLRKYSVTADELKPIVADSNDKAALDAMTSRAHVVLTTVGPYALYGNKLVESCVDNGTHYCDLTGEPHWVRKNIDLYHKRAEENGTLIVHMSGYDSIPSDIGALFVVDHLRKKGAVATEVKSFVTFFGGISGGTIASAIEAAENGDPKSLRSPHYLCPSPKSCAAAAPSKDTFLPFYDSDLKTWTAPFFMAPINRSVVRRSAALLGESAGYSPKFQYSEVMKASNVFVAGLITLGLIVFGIILAIRPTRALLKRVAPQPGTGPSRKIIETGWWRNTYVGKGRLPDGKEITVRAKAAGHQDPGYGDTARMIAESAIHLALNRDKCGKGGIVTPAIAYGPSFVDRLRTAGHDWTVESS